MHRPTLVVADPVPTGCFRADAGAAAELTAALLARVPPAGGAPELLLHDLATGPSFAPERGDATAPASL